jgi:hypothetical protein
MAVGGRQRVIIRTEEVRLSRFGEAGDGLHTPPGKLVVDGRPDSPYRYAL